MKAASLLTVPQIADRLGIAEHRINYWIKINKVRESNRIANIRVYDEAVIDDIAAAFHNKAAKEATE